MTTTTTTKKWPAYDAKTGELVGYHVRRDPGKVFTWEDTNGNPGLNGFPIKELGLYHNSGKGELGAVMAVGLGAVMVVVEGEKSSDALASIGITACSTYGASITPSDDALAPLVAAAQVILWPDNDNAGKTHMSAIASSLVRLGQREVRIINWSDSPDKGDAYDAIEMGVDIPKLINMANRIGPVATRKGSGYDITWTGLPITAEVRAVRGKNDTVKAQVAVFNNGSRVHRSTPTLDSPSGLEVFRRALSRNLSEDEVSPTFQWAKIVEDIAAEVIDRHKAGVPSVSVDEVEVSSDVLWEVDNLLVAKEPTVLWGGGNMGKSIFAQAVATWISYGYTDSSYGLVIPKKSKVLYLDYETTPHAVVNRLNKIKAGLSMSSPSGMRYRKCSTSLVNDIEALQDEISEFDIDCIVIDSLGLAVGGDLEGAQPILEFFVALAQLQCTSLILSHPNKDGKLFGSNYIYQSARSIWKLDGPAKTNVGNDQLSFTLTHEKGNDIPIQPAQGWRVNFTEDAYSFERVDVIETEGASLLSYKDLVYQVMIRFGSDVVPRTHIDKEIIEIKSEGGDQLADDKVKSNISVAISRLAKDGRVMKELTDANVLAYRIMDRAPDIPPMSANTEKTRAVMASGEWGEIL